MSRRKKKKKQSRAAENPPSGRNRVSELATAVAEHQKNPELPVSRSCSLRHLFQIALIATALWWLFLTGMALFTANPVTLNREQVNRSPLVVTAKVSDLTRGTVVVQKIWKGSPATVISILPNLNETGAKRDRTYLIPVTETKEGLFRVTETNLPGNPPLIYPATPEAERQLTELLKNP